MVANRISLGALFLAGFALFFTYKLFEQTKNQLIIQNTSFLQFKDFTLNDFEVEKSMKIDYDRINTGNLPIVIKSGKYGFTFTGNAFETNPFASITGDTLPDVYSNIFVAKESPMNAQFVTNVTIPYWVVENVLQKRFAIYFYGQIKYENAADKTKYIYTFNVKMNADDPHHSMPIYYDTKQIDDAK